ncbi:MAG: DUF624 domain-containing protein [Clostridiales bacterium]|nr:DUF624 domain-containing protein [Clostridiales bacterium]
MAEMFRGFLSNDSAFGRLMTRLGIIIAANVMFMIFSLPLVTAGAAYVALYHVMFKTLRGDGVINPFKQFWIGFKTNFKQATLYWVVLLALVAFGALDVFWCRQFGGVFQYFIYLIFAFGLIALVLTLYLFPTMAAFQDTIPNLLRNAWYFAIHRPLNLIVILFFNVFPLYLTYTDAQMMPLYGFIWVTCGFGLVALLGATLLLKEFQPYLPKVDACGDFILDEEDEAAWADSPDEPERLSAGGGAPEKSEAEILEEMKKLGM